MTTPNAPLDRDCARYLDGAIVDNGVALVTSAHRGQKNAMTATFFAESSHLPPLLRVSIARNSFTWGLVGEAGRFGLSVLAQGQEELAIRCGTGSGKGTERLATISHRMGAHGVPLLMDALTTSECLVVDALELPDFTVFVAEVVASYRETSKSYLRPLLVSELRDHVAKSHG
jgi:flavin reductase (DIM6/NTAB) family NADH-FMN oxidoreductase RutF